jgi:hypothetical protein
MLKCIFYIKGIIRFEFVLQNIQPSIRSSSVGTSVTAPVSKGTDFFWMGEFGVITTVPSYSTFNKVIFGQGTNNSVRTCTILA